MIKPILISTQNKSKICHLSPKGIEMNDIRLLENEAPIILDSINYDIILIDTEGEIVEGYWVYDETSEELVYQVNITPIPKEYPWFKIISSTNKTPNLPQLSSNSIQLLINYYNEFGCMPESVDIIKEETNKRLLIETGHAEFVLKNKIPLYKFKLNQQGEIDITIPEVEEVYETKEYKEAYKAEWEEYDIENTLDVFAQYSNKLIPNTKVKEKLYTEEEVKQIGLDFLKIRHNDHNHEYNTEDELWLEWFNSKKKTNKR